jgi:hypothetical protein
MKTIFLQLAASALVAAATPALAQVSGKVEAVGSDGNEITVAGRRIRVDDNYPPEIRIAGKPAARTDVKTGMQCKIEIARGLRDQHSGRRPPAASRVECE